MTLSNTARRSPGGGARLVRRPHRKSRNGCINCKRRKVKCDELKPACTNCVRFGISCDFALVNKLPLPRPQIAVNDTVPPGPPPRRGPGRPRKDWAALPLPLPKTKSTGSSSITRQETSPTPDPAACSLNVTDAELLFRFISYTADSLVAQDHAAPKVAYFWTHNAPCIGLSYHFVLHLCYSLAAYHMAHAEADGSLQDRQITLAEHHAAVGLSELNKELGNLNDGNCGALYLSAVLVCYCSFAAGPKSETDLLICDVGDAAPERWLPLIHGVRLIRQTIDPATLFSGLMAPLGPEGRPSVDERTPLYIRDGFMRIDWIEPLENLERLITSKESPDTVVYTRSFRGLWELYEAVYGGRDGTSGRASQYQFVFGWLYRTQDTFVSCLRRRDSFALLLLAYYVPLLTTLRKCWFLEGWNTHLLESIASIIEPDFAGWLQWPIRVSHLP